MTLASNIVESDEN